MQVEIEAIKISSIANYLCNRSSLENAESTAAIYFDGGIVPLKWICRRCFLKQYSINLLSHPKYLISLWLSCTYIFGLCRSNTFWDKTRKLCSDAILNASLRIFIALISSMMKSDQKWWKLPAEFNLVWIRKVWLSSVINSELFLKSNFIAINSRFSLYCLTLSSPTPFAFLSPISQSNQSIYLAFGKCAAKRHPMQQIRCSIHWKVWTNVFDAEMAAAVASTTTAGTAV